MHAYGSTSTPKLLTPHSPANAAATHLPHYRAPRHPPDTLLPAPSTLPFM